MRLIIAGSLATSGIYPLMLRAGHKVLALAATPAALEAQVRLERPDALLIGGELGDSPETLGALLKTLGLPAAVIVPAHWDPQPLAAVATTLPEGTPWLDALAALPVPLVAPAPPAIPAPALSLPSTPLPTAPVPSLAPGPRPPAVPLPVSGPSRIILRLCPVLGGVGASGLTLALAAAGAEAGFRSLAATHDPLAFAARLRLPPGERTQIRRSVAERLFAAVLDGAELPVTLDFDWVIIDGARRWNGADIRQGMVALLTRPTGEGRMATIRALAGLQQHGIAAAAVLLTRPGPLTPNEFTRLCTADLGSCPPVHALPEDPTVPELEDLHGHALDAPLYGPAVRRLARALVPALPWPALDPEKTSEPSGGPPRSGFRLKLPKVEVTE